MHRVNYVMSTKLTCGRIWAGPEPTISKTEKIKYEFPISRTRGANCSKWLRSTAGRKPPHLAKCTTKSQLRRLLFSNSHCAHFTSNYNLSFRKRDALRTSWTLRGSNRNALRAINLPKSAFESFWRVFVCRWWIIWLASGKFIEFVSHNDKQATERHHRSRRDYFFVNQAVGTVCV